MPRPGGLRQVQRAIHFTGSEAALIDVCRILDGAEGRPMGMADWVMRLAKRRMEVHAEAGNATARQALAVLDLAERLEGTVAPSNRPPTVHSADPRLALRALRDLAVRKGDQVAAALARAALGEAVPQEHLPAAGDEFWHKVLQWPNGDPRRCVVLAVSDGYVVYACLDRTGRRPVKLRHRVDLEAFAVAHLGEWTGSGDTGQASG